MLGIIWMLSNVDAFPTPLLPKMNSGEEVKRLKQINEILQTLDLPNKVDEDNDNDSRKYEKFRQSIDPEIVKRLLFSSPDENGESEKEMIFVWKMDKLFKGKFISKKRFVGDKIPKIKKIKHHMFHF